jgi:5'-3' exoribonuclease 2
VRDFLYGFMKDARICFPFNLENIIDDFVLLCFLVGNDFLPHLPGLDIRMGGIDILLAFYKKVIVRLKGYLTCENEINLINFEVFLKDLGRVEFELLKRIEDIQYANVR